MTSITYRALAALNGEQLLVVLFIYWMRLTELAAAAELSELEGRYISRDRVHRIHLTALNKMRRALGPRWQEVA